MILIGTLAASLIPVVLWRMCLIHSIYSVKNELRLAERRREFHVDELCRLAAQSVDRSVQDVNTFVKLAEGGYSRTFLITMHDSF